SEWQDRVTRTARGFVPDRPYPCTVWPRANVICRTIQGDCRHSQRARQVNHTAVVSHHYTSPLHNRSDLPEIETTGGIDGIERRAVGCLVNYFSFILGPHKDDAHPQLIGEPSS